MKHKWLRNTLKMFYTISHKGNTNEIYFDISSYTSYNGDKLKNWQLMLVKIQEKWKLIHWWWLWKLVPLAMEISVVFPWVVRNWSTSRTSSITFACTQMTLEPTTDILTHPWSLVIHSQYLEVRNSLVAQQWING